MEASFNFNGDVYGVKSRTEYGKEMFDDYFETLLSLEDFLFSNDSKENLEVTLLVKGC
jgi:hypothetical protein